MLGLDLENFEVKFGLRLILRLLDLENFQKSLDLENFSIAELRHFSIQGNTSKKT